MIRDWHFRSSREKISLVARVCVHRQWQIQMSHQHLRSWGFIQIQHVGVIEHQTMVCFSRVSTGSFPDMTCWDHLYSGKAPTNADIYYSIGYISILRSTSITYLLKLAKHHHTSARFTDQSQDTLTFCCHVTDKTKKPTKNSNRLVTRSVCTRWYGDAQLSSLEVDGSLFCLNIVDIFFLVTRLEKFSFGFMKVSAICIR